jgi:hypothetical protein
MDLQRRYFRPPLETEEHQGRRGVSKYAKELV